MTHEVDPADEQHAASFAKKARVTVGTHVMLLILIVLLLYVVAPAMKDLVEGGGYFPRSAKIFFAVSDAMRHHALWLCPVTFLLLWLDLTLYRHLYHRKSPAMAAWWSRGITVLLVAVLLFYFALACHTLHWLTDLNSV